MSIGLDWIVAIATLFTASMFSQALAQEEMHWQQREGEGKVFLAYEAPESSEQSLLFTCDMRNRRFSVSYRDDRDRVRDGTNGKVELSSERGKISLTMLAEKQELDDVIVLNAETSLTAELARVLSGDTLRVTLSDVVESIPLAAARDGVGVLVKACGVR